MKEIYLRTDRVVMVGFKDFLIYVTLEGVQDSGVKLLCVGIRAERF